MGAYFLDFLLVAVLVIGITATNGVIANGIGEKIFGRRRKSEFVTQSEKIQAGWKKVGGGKK